MLKTLFFLIFCSLTVQSYKLTTFYCGFSGEYCGQSKINDIHQNSTLIVLAFANTLVNGTVIMDEPNFPADLVVGLQKKGKKVVLSVGGQNGNWGYVFSSETSINNFIESLSDIVKKYRLNGVDLDIEAYQATPRTVANAIINLKKRLSAKIGTNLLIVSPEDIVICQSAPVPPNPDVAGQPFNYFLHIINLADSSIDYYQPQAYNNWYDGFPGGSLEYLKDVYLNWRNFQGLSPWGKPLENFKGVDPKKLRIGLLASPSAGIGSFYAPPNVIEGFRAFLQENKYDLDGFMIWDSHWDSENNYAISNVCLK